MGLVWEMLGCVGLGRDVLCYVGKCYFALGWVGLGWFRLSCVTFFGLCQVGLVEVVFV